MPPVEERDRVAEHKKLELLTGPVYGEFAGGNLVAKILESHHHRQRNRRIEAS